MNIVGKGTSTGVREVNTGHYQEVADVMSHSLNTAEKHCHLREKQHSAAVASNIIRKYFGTHAEVSTELVTADVTSILSPRRTWTVNEVSMIQNTFSDVIANRSVDVQCVRSKNILDKVNATEKQVVDKVRSLFRPSPENRKSLDMSSVSTFQKNILNLYFIC